MLSVVVKQDKYYSQEIHWLLEEKYHGVMGDMAQADIARIKQGEPIAYVIGFVDFLGCKIDLSQHPLIPRPETEFWVEQAIQDMGKHNVSTKIKCLDIFAGSGCIGVAVLKHIPSATVDFVDCDSEVIEQIAINCKLNGISDSRRQIIKSDMFEGVDGSYNYIFANPPYIAENKKDNVQEFVLTHEPHKALFGGPDGLVYIETFLDQAKGYLSDNGKIYMEFDVHQKDKIEKILIDKDFRDFNFYHDQFGRWRYVVLSLPG